MLSRVPTTFDYAVSTVSYDTVAAMTALTGDDRIGTKIVRGYSTKGDGGGGNFYWDAASTATADGGTIFASDAGGTGRFIRIYTGAVNVKWFGATGDGTTNDTSAIQSAIDSLSSAGGTVLFPAGIYRIARTIGTNDRWGIKIPSGNITLKGNQASLRRFNTDISTYALAYPVLFVGTPDSNAASQTQSVVIDSLTFVGENTRHSTPGAAITDFRTAIVFKNTKDTLVKDCNFTLVDSSAICYQQIAAYDYANSTYFNTTKNYNSSIRGCQFTATSHAVAGRSLLHCINADGIDSLIIDSNQFEWTDVCLSGESTYNTAEQAETDTFTYASPASRAALGAVKRQTRDITFSNNRCFNCSEHPAYPAMVNVVVANNSFYTDAPTICNTSPIQVRCRGISIVGNVISGYPDAINISEPSSQVTVSGNILRANDVADTESAAVAINANGLSSYISNRSDYLTYVPMGNISVNGNSFTGPKTLTPSSATTQNAIRVYTGTVDVTNFPDGKIFGINISGNTFENWQNGVYFVNSQYKNMVINGNNFIGKTFVRAGFNGATAMVTRTVINLNGADADEAKYTTFTNNNVIGAKYVVASRTGGFGATTLYPPEQMMGNKLDYIINTKTADVRDFDAQTNFKGNVGVAYLDRAYSSHMLMNALATTSGSGELKFNLLWTGAALRFYTDDSGTFITLGP